MSKLSLNDFLTNVNDGRVFTVEFVKRTNGERRVMNCRRGVSKGVNGTGHSFDPAKKNLLCVYDMQKINEVGEKGAFRMINLDDLISLKANGKNYVWSIYDQIFVETVKD